MFAYVKLEFEMASYEYFSQNLNNNVKRLDFNRMLIYYLLSSSLFWWNLAARPINQREKEVRLMYACIDCEDSHVIL